MSPSDTSLLGTRPNGNGAHAPEPQFNAPFQERVTEHRWAREREIDELLSGAPTKFARAAEEFTPQVQSVLIEQLKSASAESPSAPARFASAIIDRWGLDERESCRLLGLDESEVLRLRQALGGQAPSGRDFKERMRAIWRIFSTLESLFRDTETEKRFLRQQNDELDGKAPIDLIRGGSIEELLILRDFLDWRARR